MKRLRALLLRLPFAAEFAIVVGLAFGYFIVASLLDLKDSSPASFGEGDLVLLIAIESTVLLVLVPMLLMRGWRPAHIGLTSLRLADLPPALIITAASVVGNGLLLLFTTAMAPGAEAGSTGVVAPGLGLGLIVVVSVVNAIYEEVFVTGYVVAALRARTSPWTPVLVSAGLRASYHLYQGGGSLLFFIPFGLGLAYWFARNGRLWPLIVAHGILDFWALGVGTVSAS